MEKIRKISVIAAMLLITTSVTIFAQGGKGKGPHGHHGHWKSDSCRVQLRVDDLAKELSLTDSQKQKITEIHYAHMADVKKLHEEYKNDCVGARDARYQLRKEMDADIEKVLTKDQHSKYEEYMCGRRGPHGKPHGHWK